MLKLPALNYEDSRSTWADPATRITYAIPKGVSLSLSGVAAENRPTTRVFKTVDQLASVWEAGYKRGNWFVFVDFAERVVYLFYELLNNFGSLFYQTDIFVLSRHFVLHLIVCFHFIVIDYPVAKRGKYLVSLSVCANCVSTSYSTSIFSRNVGIWTLFRRNSK